MLIDWFLELYLGEILHIFVVQIFISAVKALAESTTELHLPELIQLVDLLLQTLFGSLFEVFKYICGLYLSWSPVD